MALVGILPIATASLSSLTCDGICEETRPISGSISTIFYLSDERCQTPGMIRIAHTSGRGMDIKRYARVRQRVPIRANLRRRRTYDPICGRQPRRVPRAARCSIAISGGMRDFRVDGIRIDSIENVSNGRTSIQDLKTAPGKCLSEMARGRARVCRCGAPFTGGGRGTGHSASPCSRRKKVSWALERRIIATA